MTSAARLILALLMCVGVAHAEPRHRAPVEKLPLKRVLVAAHPIAAGEVLMNDDVQLALVPVAAGHGMTVEPLQLIGATVLRVLKEGEVVDTQDVQLAAPLARGTPVRVRVRRGAVSVSASGVLERAARPGELATARLSTMHQVHGKLVANHVLEVEAGGSGDEP